MTQTETASFNKNVMLELANREPVTFSWGGFAGFFATQYSVTMATVRWQEQAGGDFVPAFAITAVDQRGRGFDYAFNSRGTLEQIFAIKTTNHGQQLLSPISPEDKPPPASALLRAMSEAQL